MTRAFKRAGLAALIALLVVAFFAPAASAKTKLVRKVDNVIMFLDYSGSMAMTNAGLKMKKSEAAQELMSSFNAEIPSDLGYNAGFYTFGPYNEIQSVGSYSKSAFGNALSSVATDYDIFGRRTPLGDGIEALAPAVAKLSGPTAIVLVSDGRSNIGADAVAAARAVVDSNSNVCFHVISLADTPEGKAILDDISGLKGCTKAAKAADLMDGGMAGFAKSILYDEVMVADPAKPEPKPVVKPEPMEEVITFRSINFAFDSAKIKPEMEPILDEAASIIKQKNSDIVLEGHTCNLGPDAYNQKLSERRAASVKAYLESRGVKASTMTSVGKGEMMPKYDNSTQEGRRLNRRVEIKFQ